MSDDDDKKRPDTQHASGPSGGGRSSGEDPLIELARIVHNNKQLGAPVSSGRVGSTDYFADLEDFASEPPRETGEQRPRQEPGFGSYAAPTKPSVSPQESARGPARREPSFSASIPAWQNPAEQDAAREPSGDTGGTRLDTVFEQTPHAGQNQFAGGPTNLSRSVAIDLEQNLTAELEDELLGALRQTIDQPAEPDVAEEQPANDPASSYYATGLQSPVTQYSHSFGAGQDPGFSPAVNDDNAGHNDQPAERDQSYTEPFAATSSEFDESAGRFAGASATRGTGQDGYDRPAASIASSARGFEGAGYGPDSVGTGSERQSYDRTSAGYHVPPAPAPAPAAPSATPRPAINEDDLFAALTNHGAPEAEDGEQDRAIAGIDTLLADLDFPERTTRRPGTAAPVHTAGGGAGAKTGGEAPRHQRPDDIDDMAWPAAADTLPEETDDDLPPPPEGYDLDAVARAMQESDPTLKGSGVLPPHSRAEQAAIPHAEERSRRGLYVAGAVLSVAVIGAAGFFFLDSGGVAVPDGPPPVISGLQEPLKIFPEEQAPAGNNQSAKLIYDRVDGNSENAPEQLAPPETPEPASLPPAPAGAQSGAELVPGATKRVRTVVVRPDGTIVSGDDGVAPAAPEPAPSEPRTVTTEPVSTGAEPVPSTPSPAPEQPRTVETVAVVPGTPAIIGGTEAVPADASVNEPAVAVPSVLPRKKPAAPVQAAQAPAAAAAPAPAPVAATPSSGPLNLTQPVATPAAATPAPVTGGVSGGSIPAGTYIVQVTSQRSAAAASDAYSGLQRRFPQVLGNRNAVIVAADLGDRGTFYRARIPTGSRDEAIRLCEQLQGAGGDCFVRQEQ